MIRGEVCSLLGVRQLEGAIVAAMSKHSASCSRVSKVGWERPGVSKFSFCVRK